MNQKILLVVVLPIAIFFSSLFCWFEVLAGLNDGLKSDDYWYLFWGQQQANTANWNAHYVQEWVNSMWDGWIWSAVSTSAFFACGVLILMFLKTDFRRMKKETDLSSSASSLKLIKLGKKKENGIFAGKYGKPQKPLYVSYEDRGLILGPPGTGKTAFLLNQILKVSDNGISFVAADIKPEIQNIIESELLGKGYKVLCINPLSPGGHHYNLLEDIADEAEINELVCNILPVNPKAEPVWGEAERKYLRMALLYLYNDTDLICSLPAAYKMFIENDDPEHFLSKILKSDNQLLVATAKKVFAELDSSKPARAGFGTVFDRLNWLYYDTIGETLSSSDFSLAELGQNRPIALFLQFEETRLKTLGTLLSVLYGHILNYLIRNAGNRGPVALFFDEIGNLPVIEGLAEKLHTIRSRMLPTYMYWQTTAQMNKYGKMNTDGPDIIFSSADLQIFFRTNSKETQQTVSLLVGTTKEESTSKSVGRSYQGLKGRKTVSESVGKVKVNVIDPHEVGELEEFEVVTLYRGGKAKGIATPYFQDYKQFFKKPKKAA